MPISILATHGTRAANATRSVGATRWESMALRAQVDKPREINGLREGASAPFLFVLKIMKNVLTFGGNALY